MKVEVVGVTSDGPWAVAYVNPCVYCIVKRIRALLSQYHLIRLSEFAEGLSS